MTVIHSIPGAPPVPLLGAYGNLLPFVFDPVMHMCRLHQTYGEIAALARDTPEFVFVFSPEYNQQVLGNTELFYARDAKSLPLRIPVNSALERLFAGLHQMNGAKHEQQRRLMMPAFQHKRFSAYCDDIVALTEQKLVDWRAGQQLDIFCEMRELTLAIAIKTRLGLDPSQDGKTISKLLECWINMVFSIPVLLLPFNFLGLPYHRLLKLSQLLEAEIKAIIQRKRISGISQGDVLSILLHMHDEDGTRLTDEELVGQTATLFVAGHDITARVLTWTFFLLSQHPHVIGDLLDELDSKLHGGTPTLEQLSELPLLEWVIKESMRLLPPVLWWSRVSTTSFELGPYSLPQGATVIVSHYITHRLPDLYPQPNRFIPERWRIINPEPYEYIPFSAGPRICMGAASAMMEMKIILSIILQRYHLKLPSKARIDRSGLMLSAPKQGLQMILTRQVREFTKIKVHGNIRNIVDLE